MLKRYSRLFVITLMASDAVIILGSWIAAYDLRFFLFPGRLVKGLPPFSSYLLFSPLMILLCLFTLQIRGLYRSRRTQNVSWEVARIAQAITLAIGLAGIVTFFYRGISLSRGMIIYFWFITVFGLSSFRVGVKLILRYLRAKGFNLRYVLIVGVSHSGLEFARNIENHSHLGLVIEGFVDDGMAVGEEPLPGIPVLGKIEDLTRVLGERTIDQVFIALPRHADQDLEHILWLLSEQVVDIRIIPDFSQFVALNASVEEFEGMPIINLTERPLHGWRRISKRAFDISLSLLGLVALSPLLALIALLVKISSSGPVFYVQERIGYDGRKFSMYKFRSMRMDAEKETGAVWATKNDPRCTILGKFLRKFSLDELPQFWNVFKGDMSFVGPRPEREVFVDAFKKRIPRYMMRHKIKSGITGWAQVNGLRGESPIEKRTQLDLFYIKNWSFWFDVKIILLTIAKIFRDDHAY